MQFWSESEGPFSHTEAVTQPLGLWHSLECSEAAWTWLNINWGMFLGTCSAPQTQISFKSMGWDLSFQSKTQPDPYNVGKAWSTAPAGPVSSECLHSMTYSHRTWKDGYFDLKMPRLISRPLLRFKFNQKYFKFIRGKVTPGRPFFLQKTRDSGCISYTTAGVKRFSPTQIHVINTWATSHPVFWREKFHPQTFIIIEVNSNLSISSHEICLFPEKEYEEINLFSFQKKNIYILNTLDTSLFCINTSMKKASQKFLFCQRPI